MSVEAKVANIIRRKKAQYVRYIDTKQWSKFEELALADAELSFHNSDGSVMTLSGTAFQFSSVKSFTAYFSKFFAQAQTLHMVGHGELERIGAGEVRAIWGMEDQIMLPLFAEIRGGGYYHETWVLKNGGWFLKSLRLERTYMKYNFVATLGSWLQSTGVPVV
ncbi:hypothetical protein PT974_04742 [Cladobotryum mycophilum]|uniref:SnoaL-like domain-containing protein n=1 Tax=Cladobotryum mycophilum TaxID=491253 RepID=A0ABR0SQ11_9HYPO